MKHNQVVIILFILSFISVLITGKYVSDFTEDYYSFMAYTPDPMEGLIRNQEAYRLASSEGRLISFFNEFEYNSRSPLVAGFPLLVNPELLRNVNAHLMLVLPLLFFFLFLLGYLTWIRTKQVLYSIALIIFYITTYAVIVPYFGIGYNMPDTIAGYAAGCAGLCLLLWFERNKFLWLVLFSLSLSLAVLIRYIFSVYAFLIFSFPIIYILYQNFQYSKNFYSDVMKPLLVILIIVGGICGYFLIKHFNVNYEYYSFWSTSGMSTMNIGMVDSAISFLYIFAGLLRKIHLLLLLVVLLFNLFFFNPDTHKYKQRIIIAAWFILILPFYWIVILKANGYVVSSIYLAGFPLIFASIALPFKELLISRRKKSVLILSLILITAGLTDAAISVNKNSKFLSDNYQPPDSLKQFSVDAANLLHSISPADSTVSMYAFSDRFIHENISLNAFYKRQREINTHPQLVDFRLNKYYWQSLSFKSNIDSMTRVYETFIREKYNVLLFFPEQYKLNRNGFNNPVSEQIAENLYELMSHDSDWKQQNIQDNNLGNYILMHRNYLILK